MNTSKAITFLFILLSIGPLIDVAAQNVGIGIINPLFKLDVRNGSINTDSVYRIGLLTVLSAPGTNLFVGKGAGILNTGIHNTFHGYEAGKSNTSGIANSFFGRLAGRDNQLGHSNSFFGEVCGLYNTGGINNAFFGHAAGYNNEEGDHNSFFGSSAGVNNEGDQNSFFGQGAGWSTSTGDNNTAIGVSAMFNNMTGSYNTALGHTTNVGFDNLVNATAVGSKARVDCSNCMVLGSVNGINDATSNVNVGIGVNAPQYRLDVAGRMRLRHEGGVFTAGMWFNDSGNIPYTFAGMRSDSIWGLYAVGYKFNFDMENSRLGIGAIIPQYPLAFDNGIGDKISLWGGSGLPNADHYGFGIQSSLMQLFTPASNTDIAFGYGRSAAFTERMRIKGNGNVGIGNVNPVDAGLIVDKKVGAVNAMFGRNTTGVSIESNSPGIGFNSYYNGGRKTIATGYTGLLSSDPVNGNLGLYSSNVSTSADATATMIPRLIINKDGDIGVEGVSTPHTPLTFATSFGRKVSFYGSIATSHHGIGVQPSVLQFYVGGSGADMVFGTGYSESFSELVRIKGSGNVGIGTDDPDYRLDIKRATAELFRMENSLALASNVRTDLYFKTGTYNTGAIKTIGTASNAARLGFFTFAATNPNLLVERMSILDNGYVGIGTTNPFYKLEVTGNTTNIARIENTFTGAVAIGVYGKSISSSTGTGLYGEGSETGVFGDADFAGTGNRFGVRGFGRDGANNNYGIYAKGQNGTTAFGIFAEGLGATTNWGGFFLGDIYTNGTYVGSDRKLKSEIRPLSNAVSIIKQLKPSTYKYNTVEYDHMHFPKGIQYGLVADEVMQVLPVVVKKTILPAQFENTQEGRGEKISDEVEFNAVNYTAMIPILIGAIQEQQKQMDLQQQQIGDQQQQIDDLKKLVGELIQKN